MNSLLCPCCGGNVRSEQVQWRPSGFAVGCYWSHCNQQPTTAVMPTLAEARKEWREGRVSPRPKKCPTCNGRKWIWLVEYPTADGEYTEAACIECNGTGLKTLGSK